MINTNNSKKILPNNVILGEFSYICSNTAIINTTIGKFCSIASNVKIGLGFHPTNEFISTHPSFYATNNIGCKISFTKEQLFEEFKPITIGNDVWIGNNAIVLDGVNIGNGAIIGAGAIVTKDIPPYAIAVGVPAQIIKYRFKDEEIKILENFKWWDRPIEWIITNAKSFQSNIFFEKIKNNEFDDSNKMINIEDYFINNTSINEKKNDFSFQFNKLFNKIEELRIFNQSYVIYGNGTIGKTIRALLPDHITNYVDIADKKHHPSNLKNMKYDKIIISVLGREQEIIKYLTNELNVDINKIITIEI